MLKIFVRSSIFVTWKRCFVLILILRPRSKKINHKIDLTLHNHFSIMLFASALLFAIVC